MTETYSTELYRQEGDQSRSVRLSVDAEDSVRLDAQDMGTPVKRYGAIATTSSGLTFPRRRFANWHLLCSVKNTLVEVERSTSSAHFASAKISNTNGIRMFDQAMKVVMARAGLGY